MVAFGRGILLNMFRCSPALLDTCEALASPTCHPACFGRVEPTLGSQESFVITRLILSCFSPNLESDAAKLSRS